MCTPSHYDIYDQVLKSYSAVDRKHTTMHTSASFEYSCAKSGGSGAIQLTCSPVSHMLFTACYMYMTAYIADNTRSSWYSACCSDAAAAAAAASYAYLYARCRGCMPSSPSPISSLSKPADLLQLFIFYYSLSAFPRIGTSKVKDSRTAAVFV